MHPELETTMKILVEGNSFRPRLLLSPAAVARTEHAPVPMLLRRHNSDRKEGYAAGRYSTMLSGGPAGLDSR